MPFNRIFRWTGLLLLFSLTGLLIQCSYFFDEKEQEEQVSYDKRVGTCVSEASHTMKNYFHEGIDVSPEALDEAVNCYQKTIESFVTNTKSGDVNNSKYTAENLFGFLDKFYPDYGLDTDRIQGYIYLKGFLLGGERTSVSKKELMVLHELLPVLSEGLKKLLPHRKILLRQESLKHTKEDYGRFKGAFAAFKKELGHFMVSLDEHEGKRSIELDTIAMFLFEEFYADEAESKAKYLDAIKAFKNMALNRTGSSLKRLDLSFLLRQATTAYEGLTQFNYFVKQEGEDRLFTNLGHVVSFITRIPVQLANAQIFQTVTFNSLLDVFEAGESVLNYGVRTRKNQKIDFKIIQELFDGLQAAEVLGDPLTASTLGLFIEKFSEKWLDPGNTRGSEITEGKISYIKRLLDEWFSRQKIVNSLFNDPRTKEVSLMEMERPLRGVEELDHWISILEKLSTTQWNKKRRVLYSKNMRNFTYEEMTASNSMLILVDLFLAPYNLGKKDPIDFTIDENQAQEIYKVLRILGVEMAFMDSRVADSGHRSFMEANNFSTQNRNDGVMDFYESIEYLSVAMSSGKTADAIYEQIPEECRLDYRDVHKELVNDKDCFKKFLVENYGRFFEHLPTIDRFWKGSNQRTREKFLGSVEYASRAGVITDKPWDLTEIRVLVSVTNYLQAIFYMFDSSHDGMASGGELKVAERHFKPMIADFILSNKRSMLTNNKGLFLTACGEALTEQQKRGMSPMVVEEYTLNYIAECLAPKLFIHLLEDGRLPTGNPITDGATRNFLMLLDRHSEQEAFATVQASPREVLRVFSALSKVTHTGHVQKVKDFIVDRWEELLSSLDSDEAPECLHINYENYVRTPSIFCEWSRALFCTESVNDSVFSYFKDNKYNLFPVAAYKHDPDEAVLNTMENISFIFQGHRKFSTHCAFPKFEKSLLNDAGDLIDEASDVVTEPFEGNEEDIGIGEKIKDWWKSL